jgi:hypothetical protein
MSIYCGSLYARTAFARSSVFSYRTYVNALYVDVGAARLRGRAFHFKEIQRHGGKIMDRDFEFRFLLDRLERAREKSEDAYRRLRLVAESLRDLHLELVNERAKEVENV